jgi:hypothetical protein
MVELLLTCDRDALFAGFPRRLPVLPWHGDMFDLPPGAQPLAQNARYPNQAFRMGEAAWGLQFQLEVTADAVHGFLDAFSTDAARAPGGAVAVRATTAAALDALVPWRDLAFDRFATLVGAKEADRWTLDLVTVSPIFLNCELWQSPLPLRQLRPTLGAWS